MANSSIAIVTAGIAATVTIVGWNVSHYLAKKREDRTRRIESSIRRLERQIEEFYGPLLSLIEQIFNISRMQCKILNNNDDDVSKDKINKFIWEEYFLPLHVEIRNLIKAKFYLVNDKKVALSLKKYLEHSTQELLQNRISNELKISTEYLKGIPWPTSFDHHVKEAIITINKKRNDLIKDLEVNK